MGHKYLVNLSNSLHLMSESGRRDPYQIHPCVLHCASQGNRAEPKLAVMQPNKPQYPKESMADATENQL